MNHKSSFVRKMGILALLVGLLLVVVIAVQSVPGGSQGRPGSEDPYPVFDRPYPPPRFTDDPNIYLTATAEEAALMPQDPTMEPGPTLIPTPLVTPIPIADVPVISVENCPAAGPGTLFFRQGSALISVLPDGSKPRTLVDIEERLGLYLAGDAVGVHDTDWISVSPDGKLVALVVSSDPGPPEKGKPVIQLDIYLYDRESGELSLLLEHATDPAWSPDGSRIAYISEGNLWVLDLASGRSREIYRADEKDEQYVDSLEWSPDGNALVFIDKVFRQETTLKTVEAATGEVLLEVMHPLYFMYFPQWSPDGSRILYVTADGKASASERFSNLWIVDAEGNNRDQITQDIEVFTQPQWSADGNWIVFAGPIGYEQVDTDYDLWVTDTSGSTLKRLTASSGISELSPAWSTDCTSIYFTVGNSMIKTISLIEGNEKEVQSAEGKFVISN